MHKSPSPRHHGGRLIDFEHLTVLLATIATGRRIGRQDLVTAVGSSLASVARLLAAAHQRCGVRIIYDRVAWSYRIEDWGVFDRAAILRLAKTRTRE